MIRTNFEMKKHNTEQIFRAFQTSKSLSRREIERLTGLSWGTVSAVCNDLLTKKLLVANKTSGATGRPPELLKVNPAYKLSLGIDINSVGLSFDAISLSFESVYSAFEPVRVSDRERLLDFLKKKTAEILRAYPEIVTVNLSMQGKLNATTGVSIRSNFFEDWDNVPLVKLFEEEFGLPTYLYHDPECLLTYHISNDRRLQRAKNGIMVRIDDGIGMAQLINGELYRTENDSSCELGHTIVEESGEPCPCGKRGCLELYGALRGMKKRYRQETGVAIDSIDPFFDSNDPVSQNIKRRATDRLGVALANLHTLYNPSFLLVDGVACAKIPAFFEDLKNAVERYLNAPCNVLLADYKHNSAAIGAAMLTIENHLEELLFYDEMRAL